MALKRMDANCCCRHNQYRDEIKVSGTWYKIITYKTLCLGYVSGCPSTRFIAKGEVTNTAMESLKDTKKEILMNASSPSVDSINTEGVSITILLLGSSYTHVWTCAVV